MQKSAYVIVAYPISQAFKGVIAGIVGDNATTVMLAEMRTMGLWRMIRMLRGLGRNATIYIPLEDTQGEALLPVLIAIAALSSAGETVVITADSSTRRVPSLQWFTSAIGVLVSSVAGFYAVLMAKLQVSYLLRQRPASYQIKGKGGDLLYVNANLWFGVRAGGSVAHISGVVNAFSELGYKVDLVSANPQAMLRTDITQIPLGAPATYGFPYEVNYFRYNRKVITKLKSLPPKQYKFCYQRMSIMNYAGVVLARRLGIPLILEYNGSEVWVANNWGRGLRFSKLALAIEDLCLRQAYRVVVVSEALREELIRRSVSADKIVSYPNCVDVTHYNPSAVSHIVRDEVRQSLGISSDTVLAMFVGTFGQWHGASVMAAAIKQLVDQDSGWLEQQNVHFAFVGDGVKMKEVLALVGGEKYRRWVTFTGLIAQARTVNYLATADILISPHVQNADGSKFFGSPTKLFEYMAMGKGIIASDLDQIGEVLSAGIRIWQSSSWPVRADRATASSSAARGGK